MSWGFDVDQALSEAGYKYEFEYGYWGYDWNITKVYTRDGRVFTLHDSGCSCSGFGDHYQDVDGAIGDLCEVTRIPQSSDIAEDWELTYFDEKVETIQEKFRGLGLR